MSENFYVNFSSFRPVVLEKKILKIFFSYKHMYIFPYCGPFRPPGATILTNLLLYYECFQVNFSFSSELVLEEDF
jgi:hypothetical protein